MNGSDAAVRIAKSQPTPTKKELHAIPCRLEYSGPANVSSFFVRKEVSEKVPNENEVSSFRGRGLNGTTLTLPPGYELNVLKQKTTGVSTDWSVIDRMSSVVNWEWDRDCSQSSMNRAFQTLQVAQALYDD